MLIKWMGAIFASKYPRHYTGRHRAARGWRPSYLPAYADEDAFRDALR